MEKITIENHKEGTLVFYEVIKEVKEINPKTYYRIFIKSPLTGFYYESKYGNFTSNEEACKKMYEKTLETGLDMVVMEITLN